MAPSTEHEQQHDERVEGDDPTEAEQALENLSLSDPAPNEALRAYSARMAVWTKARLEEWKEDVRYTDVEPHSGRNLPQKAKRSSEPVAAAQPIQA